ncbi:aladin [Cloeon dipterum]|uniref:aladin n=1 Tax=Cloeon dipterum TaxID=197152 RepID=UPI00321F9119
MTDIGMDFSVTSVPPDGQRWFCELDGRLHSRPRQGSFNPESPLLAALTAYCENLDAPSDKAHDHWRAPLDHQPGGLFLSAPTSTAKAAVAAFYHHGWVAGLEVLSKQNRLLDRVLRSLAPKHQVGGHRPLMAAHPTDKELAVAFREDVVRVVGWAKGQAHDFKSKFRVLCLGWRPYAHHLVAGCAAGLLVWSAKQENKQYSDLPMSTGRHCLLPSPNSCPVAAVAWQPKGDYLVAAAGNELYLVRPETEHWWLLPRGAAAHLLLWSPCGRRLLAASSGASFHLWNAATWTAERWTVARGSLVAAAFSPDGRLMLFGDEAGLYCLPTDGQAFLIEQTRVTALAWDGTVLAAIHHGSAAVHVYSTRTDPQLNIRPYFVIDGKEGEIASSINFFPGAKGASLLVILWSSGRVQSFPFTTQEAFSKANSRRF